MLSPFFLSVFLSPPQTATLPLLLPLSFGSLCPLFLSLSFTGFSLLRISISFKMTQFCASEFKFVCVRLGNFVLPVPVPVCVFELGLLQQLMPAC